MLKILEDGTGLFILDKTTNEVITMLESINSKLDNAVKKYENEEPSVEMLRKIKAEINAPLKEINDAIFDVLGIALDPEIYIVDGVLSAKIRVKKVEIENTGIEIIELNNILESVGETIEGLSPAELMISLGGCDNFVNHVNYIVLRDYNKQLKQHNMKIIFNFDSENLIPSVVLKREEY